MSEIKVGVSMRRSGGFDLKLEGGADESQLLAGMCGICHAKICMSCNGFCRRGTNSARFDVLPTDSNPQANFDRNASCSQNSGATGWEKGGIKILKITV